MQGISGWTRFALAAAIGTGAAVVVLAEDPPPAPDWGWLSPGRSTREEVERRSGPCCSEWRAVIERGALDPSPLPAAPGPGGIPLPRIVADPKARVELAVLDYGNDPATGARRWLAFHGDRLLYAILPPKPGESSVREVLSRHGGDPRTFPLRANTPSCAQARIVIEYAGRRLAFLCRRGTGDSIEAVEERVVWADEADLDPEVRASWRLPERKQVRKQVR